MPRHLPSVLKSNLTPSHSTTTTIPLFQSYTLPLPSKWLAKDSPQSLSILHLVPLGCPPCKLPLASIMHPHANIFNSTSKNADDIVITLAIRTPLTKAFKGGFKDTELEYLLYSLLKKVAEKSRLDPQLVEDICCGNVSIPYARIPRLVPVADRQSAGQRWQSRIQTPCRSPCCRLPQHRRRLHRQSFLLLRSQGHTRHCQPNRIRQHRHWYCRGR